MAEINDNILFGKDSFQRMSPGYSFCRKDMKKEQLERIVILFEEIIEMMECVSSKIKNVPPENNNTADAIRMLDEIKRDLKFGSV